MSELNFVSNHWLLLYLTVSDNVAFLSDQSDGTHFMAYKKFIEYASELGIKDYEKFVDTINCFETIFIDFRTKEWSVYKEERKIYGYEELAALNKPKEEKEEKSFVDKVREDFSILKDRIQQRDATRLRFTSNNPDKPIR